MITPFKPGDKVWVGRWIAGEFQRVAKTEVICMYCDSVCLNIDGYWRFAPVCDIERIPNDLNQFLK